MRRLARLIVLVLPLAGYAVAQPAPTRPPSAAQPAPPPVPAVPDPPYQARLERLAEILGALHHLRGLCLPAEVDLWRREMASLLDAEAPPPARRDRLVGAFNRGLAAFRETHHACTPAARLAAERYRTEATALARDVATRFAD